MPPKKVKNTALAAKSSNVTKNTATASQKKSGITKANYTPSKANPNNDQHTAREESPVEDSITLQSRVEKSIAGPSATGETGTEELADIPMGSHDVVKSDVLIQMDASKLPKGSGNTSRKPRADPAKKRPVPKRPSSASSTIEAATDVAAPKKKCKVNSTAAEPSKITLLDLPAEIRLMIYQYAVANERSCIIFVRRARLQLSRRKIQRRGKYKSDYFVKCGEKEFRTTYKTIVSGYCVHNQWRSLKLMWICALIRKEVIPIVFAGTKFNFLGIDVVQPFLRDLTEDQRRSIRHVQIECGGSEEIHRDWTDLREEAFGYLVNNVDLKSLCVEAKDDDFGDYCPCCEEVHGFDFDLESPDWKWVQKLCELENLESVFIDVLNFDPDRGYEVWLDNPGDFSEPEYDGSLDWLPVCTLSEDVEWRVAESVLKPAAWEERKNMSPGTWERIVERRMHLLEARAEAKAEATAEMAAETAAEMDAELVAEMAAEKACRKRSWPGSSVDSRSWIDDE